MDGEKNKGCTCFALWQIYERESFLKIIYQSFTPISMFNSYPENVLHQELYVCEKAHGEFTIWTWAFFIVQSFP